MKRSKQLGNYLTSLKEPVPPSEPTGLKPMTRPFPFTSLGHLMKFGQLERFSNQNMCPYRLNLTLKDSGRLSKTLPTLRPKPVTLSPSLTNLRGKAKRNSCIVFYFFSVRGNVTQSTIVATIHCPDVGYCLFRNPLVTHIPYNVPCTILIVIVSYWVVLSFVFAHQAPFTPLNPIRIVHASYHVLLD